MRRELILCALTATLLGPLTLDAHAASAPAPKDLKAALVTKWKGKKFSLRSGTVKSLAARPTEWGYSRMPARCKTPATEGLLYSSRVVHALGKQPAALATLSTKGSYYGETLISVPATASAGLFKPVVPKGCARVKVKHYDGKRITVRIVKVHDLPAIPGATVTAIKMKFTPSPWESLPNPESMLTVVRSGPLVMETYTDSADGDVETVANAFTEAAWRRATGKLLP
ncbi:hypothetical protein [Nonomuraea sp. NPDC048916]|uniref:hypothetical protein n=1 Tax=Nonomuraea sp. NPDC048916 TaxID=3154232 RepID=UPI0033E68820